jgi:hypothetical protein
MRTSTFLIVTLLLPVAAAAQENVRKLEGPGQQTKHLTPGQLDTWLFDGEKGETVIAYVSTKEFDPILELAVKGEKEDRVLLEVDDEGSESRFAFRLPEKGEYRIRIHAFKYQGGGNYALSVQRFQAKPLEVGKPAVGTFDREGKGYHYFRAEKDHVLLPALKGASADAWKMLDPKGREMAAWMGAVHVADAGEHCLIVSGAPNARYDLLVREARRRDLGGDKDLAGTLQQGEMDVWSFQGKPGDFRLVEVEKKGELAARLIYAPPDAKNEQRLARPGSLPAIQYVPVASRGGYLRFGVFLGREGRYQLHLLATTPASYKLTAADPSVPVERGKELKGSLPVGGSAFYSFKASAGQLVQTSLASPDFVPLLRLYDFHGRTLASDEAGRDGLESRVTQMLVEPGLYRLQVASLGDGGGGDFRLSLAEVKLKELEIGGRGQGAIQPGATDYWTFAGKEGKTLIVSARSATCDPAVRVLSPDGVQLPADDRRAAGADGVVFFVKLPKTGRYTVWVASRGGAGDYTLRLIDGD